VLSSLPLLATTPLGRAAGDSLTSVVPYAKTAGFAKLAGNSAKLNGRKSTLAGIPGTIPVVGANGKLPAAIGAVGSQGPQGPQGPKGSSGAPGISGLQIVGLESPTAIYKSVDVSAACPTGKKLIGGGAYVSPSGEPAALTASWPDTGRNQWTASARQYATDNTTYWGVYVFAFCANVSP
jgi:hypothetical protein